MTCAPALSTASTSSPSRAKSAERMEGAIQGVCMASVYAGRPLASEPGGLLQQHMLMDPAHTCANTEQLRRSGQPRQRLEVIGARLLDDVRWQRWPRCLLLPIQRFEVIAYKLLIEAGRARSNPIGVGRPETR